MVRKFIVIFVLGFFIFGALETHAAFGHGMGGNINAVNDNTQKIMEAQSGGYQCKYSGTLIEVLLPGSGGEKETYYAPIGVKSVTNTTPAHGQGILGTLTGFTVIFCTNEDGKIKMLLFRNIGIYGTSSR